MSHPPIVPGPDPYEPQQQQYQPQPVPVYQVGRSDIVGKSAIGTVTVVATLVLIFCVAPLVVCAFLGVLGNLGKV